MTVEEIFKHILELEKKDRKRLLSLLEVAAAEAQITPPPLPEKPGGPPVGP